jgi:hypothetical protein
MDGDDARVTEQLFEELVARCWALGSVAEGVCDVVDHTSTRVVLGRVAERLVHDVTVGTSTRHDLLRVLHPVAVPGADDEWWATPLGRLLGRPQRPRRRPRADVVGGAVGHHA